MGNSEIIKNNVLIAQFMGMAFTPTKTILLDKSVKPQRAFNQEDLKYNSDWNWLMKVVQKIQDTDITPPPNYKGYRIEIVIQGYVQISGFPMPKITTNVSIEGSVLKALYKAVLEFIHYVNLNK